MVVVVGVGFVVGDGFGLVALVAVFVSLPVGSGYGYVLFGLFDAFL